MAHRAAARHRPTRVGLSPIVSAVILTAVGLATALIAAPALIELAEPGYRPPAVFDARLDLLAASASESFVRIYLALDPGSEAVVKACVAIPYYSGGALKIDSSRCLDVEGGVLDAVVRVDKPAGSLPEDAWMLYVVGERSLIAVKPVFRRL